MGVFFQTECFYGCAVSVKPENVPDSIVVSTYGDTHLLKVKERRYSFQTDGRVIEDHERRQGFVTMSEFKRATDGHMLNPPEDAREWILTVQSPVWKPGYYIVETMTTTYDGPQSSISCALELV